MSNRKIIDISPLGFTWKTYDPFLFCAYHNDKYPKGNENLGPNVSLKGRDIGQDFVIKDGWRMYHGDKVPGFPSHPHRGFETITILEKGIVDHSDSLGGAGRFGKGDVQWMTAGRGIQHSEMFPLLNRHSENPLEMFQIWLNLPRANKLVEPHFEMIWNDKVPVLNEKDSSGKSIDIRLISGKMNGIVANCPATNSWAFNLENEVLICTIKIENGAKWVLPKACNQVSRTLYFYKGSSLDVEGEIVSVNNYISANPNEEVNIMCGEEDGFILMLQGKPINEPIAQYGPFVMNTQSELQQTFSEYQQTQFGGWPWERRDQVHDKDRRCFALYSDGSEELKREINE